MKTRNGIGGWILAGLSAAALGAHAGEVPERALQGKVQIVTAFPDYKIEVVEHFPDLKVKRVKAPPTREGEWQIVEHFPDFKVQIVEHFGDFKVQWVEHFPGR